MLIYSNFEQSWTKSNVHFT